MTQPSKIAQTDLGALPSMASMAHWKPWWMAIGLALACSLCITFRSHMVSVVEDDYFYYHIIARNYLDGLGTSFFPGVPTNGYQPLWQGVIIGVLAISDWTGADALRTSHFVAVMAGYAAVVMLCLKLARHEPLRLMILPTLATCAFYFANMGMEAVAIFIVYALYAMHISRPVVKVLPAALLLFGCFMARIDSVVYILPMSVYLLRQRVWLLGRILVGFGALTGLYLALNQWLYGSPVPISGLAKNASHIHLHWATFESLWRHNSHRLIMLMALVASLGVHLWKPALRHMQGLSWACVVGFFLLHALRSDYGVWSWYLYPFALHMVTLAAFHGHESAQAPASSISPLPASVDRRAMLRGAQGLGFACMAVMVGWHTWQHMSLQTATGAPRHNLLVQAGQFVSGVVQRSGARVIAMGDRAGAVAYLSGTPLVQLEGLVMDRAFLHSLSVGTPLTQILGHYKVDLYIASSPRPSGREGCHLVSELAQATDRRTEQEICHPVIGVYEPDDGPRTVIFDLRRTVAGVKG